VTAVVQNKKKIFTVEDSKNPHTRTCGLRTARLKFGKKGAYIRTHSA